MIMRLIHHTGNLTIDSAGGTVTDDDISVTGVSTFSEQTLMVEQQ